ncbi:MAG: hypothetical protein PHT07_10795 [Paludibacter sp.]|nr:hypothetical protein [Paludibacter sp.]
MSIVIALLVWHFIKKDKYLVGAGFFFMPAALAGYLYFHQTKEISYTSSKDITSLGDDFKCYYGGKECDFNTDTHNIECGYWRGNESQTLTCKYKDLQKNFLIPEKNSSVSLDDMFLVVDDMKVSFKNDQLIANFSFKNPITNNMVPLDGHKEINVSICEKLCKAKINVDSTYTVRSKRSEIETVFKKNCEDKISVRQNLSGCDALKEFDISVPFDNKNVYMKDNHHIFTGNVRQNSLPLYTNKQFFDTTMKVDFLEPTVCFVLGLGDSTLKIENGIVSLNGTTSPIPKLDVREPAYLRIQKNYNNVNILISQESSLSETIQADCQSGNKKKITFGYTLKSKLKKDVLSVYIGEFENIRVE